MEYAQTGSSLVVLYGRRTAQIPFGRCHLFSPTKAGGIVQNQKLTSAKPVSFLFSFASRKNIDFPMVGYVFVMTSSAIFP